MPYNLFLDDIRNPRAVGNYMEPKYLRAQYYEEVWVVVRNYDLFVKLIEDYGLPVKVSFDHDLAQEHYTMAGNESYATFIHKTGLDAARYFIHKMQLDNNFNAKVYVHSMNPVGTHNIITEFEKINISCNV